jgi:hypothetical protein
VEQLLAALRRLEFWNMIEELKDLINSIERNKRLVVGYSWCVEALL